MPCVHLKGGEIVEVPLEELESYLYENADNILIRKVERRRPQRQLSKGGYNQAIKRMFLTGG